MMLVIAIMIVSVRWYLKRDSSIKQAAHDVRHDVAAAFEGEEMTTPSSPLPPSPSSPPSAMTNNQALSLSMSCVVPTAAPSSPVPPLSPLQPATIIITAPSFPSSFPLSPLSPATRMQAS
jgi:hypothetical protein